MRSTYNKIGRHGESITNANKKFMNNKINN